MFTFKRGRVGPVSFLPGFLLSLKERNVTAAMVTMLNTPPAYLHHCLETSRSQMFHARRGRSRCLRTSPCACTNSTNGELVVGLHVPTGLQLHHPYTEHARSLWVSRLVPPTLGDPMETPVTHNCMSSPFDHHG